MEKPYIDNIDSTNTAPSRWRKFKTQCKENWFYITLISVALTGVFCAFILPPLIPKSTDGGDSVDSIRKAILAVFAGALTMLTLWETHRKNTQEKDKNDRDHIRQVHAERRSRYAKAIEHIADDKAVVRLGGIYTLVSLVDEWLTDESIKDIDDRRKEGQVIVNNLCAYIRSPFHLAEKRDILELDSRPAKYKGDFAADQAEFFEECNVRKSIFEEINKRITVKIDENNINEREAVGSWSKFIFNFDAAPIFYFLQYLTYVNSSFHAAKFYGRTFFSNSHFFGGTDFTDAVFYGPADFNDTFFVGDTFFRWAKFNGPTSFQAIFKKKADFENAEFLKSAKFVSSQFNDATYFKNVHFSQKPIFAEYIHSHNNHPKNCHYVHASFSYKIDSTKHNFMVSSQSLFSIPRSNISFKNNNYEIPKGTVIFNPDSWDKDIMNYREISPIAP